MPHVSWITDSTEDHDIVYIIVIFVEVGFTVDVLSVLLTRIAVILTVIVVFTVGHTPDYEEVEEEWDRRYARHLRGPCAGSATAGD